MIRSKDKLNSGIMRIMGARSTANVHNKKFAFFVYKDVPSHIRAAKFFAAMDLMGAFQARPRAFAGIPKLCHACGLLQDEADAAEVAWHQAGDGRCQKHEYKPGTIGRSRPPTAQTGGSHAVPPGAMDADSNDEVITELINQMSTTSLHRRP
jgi:hypothetical protein